MSNLTEEYNKMVLINVSISKDCEDINGISFDSVWCDADKTACKWDDATDYLSKLNIPADYLYKLNIPEIKNEDFISLNKLEKYAPLHIKHGSNEINIGLADYLYLRNSIKVYFNFEDDNKWEIRIAVYNYENPIAMFII